jgi:hypothetical protein
MEGKDELGLILTECFFVLGQSLAGQRVTPEALAFWHDRYHERFSVALRSTQPGAWQSDRRNVLAKSRTLGRKAATIAAISGSPVIELRHAEAASEANDCRPNSEAGARLLWCEPVPSRGHVDSLCDWGARIFSRLVRRPLPAHE